MSVPPASGAALPLAGLTAWQTVFEHAKLIPGERVLVNGAGGGIGGYVTQLATYAGAEVVATAGPRSAETVRRQGAARVVDYTAGRLADALGEPVDVLLNLVPLGPVEAAALVPLVRRGGRIVSVTNPFEPPAGSGVTAAHMVARNDPAQLSKLVELVDAGTVTVAVSATHRLADLATVHRLGEAGLLRGKVLITP